MGRIVLTGGGGHCASVIDAVRSGGGYDIAGVVDHAIPMGGDVLGFSLIDSDDLPALRSSGANGVVVAVGSIRVADSRPEDATVPEAKSPSGTGRFLDDLVRRQCRMGEVHT